MSRAYGKFALGLVRVFAFGFLGVFIPGLTGLAAAPNWDAGKAAAVALIGGAVAAAVKAVVDTLTNGKTPIPGVGVLPRKTAP
jgi:hypothetical protein